MLIQAPQKEGIYQFKLIYKKPGYTFLTLSERVTVRPYKHDEYERFLMVAAPYNLGLALTIISTFVFLVVYLYSSFRKGAASKILENLSLTKSDLMASGTLGDKTKHGKQEWSSQNDIDYKYVISINSINLSSLVIVGGLGKWTSWSRAWTQYLE